MDKSPRPDDDNQDGQRDLDAEFAALMDDVEIPDDLSAVDDLDAPEGPQRRRVRGEPEASDSPATGQGTKPEGSTLTTSPTIPTTPSTQEPGAQSPLMSPMVSPPTTPHDSPTPRRRRSRRGGLLELLRLRADR